MARKYTVKAGDNGNVYVGHFVSGKNAVLKYRQYRDKGMNVMIGNRQNGSFLRAA